MVGAAAAAGTCTGDYYFLPLSPRYIGPQWGVVPDYVYAPAAYSLPPGYGYLPFVARLPFFCGVSSPA